ncbi:MAG: recombinase family protein [Lachnospiraceae bacterium]|nr:recombinase family protein [Lachnospiraceae bacterium]
MTRGACYVRVSTDNQLENYSIEEQTDRLKSYCAAKDITITKFYTDGGYSGGNINRPALQQMLTDIETGAIDVVVVYKLDRLSRSQKDTLMLIEDKFLAHNVNFISVNENFDTASPFGKAMIGMLSVFAQLEKDQITERFTMGRIGRAKNGYYHGGPTAPTGYDYADGCLIVNDYEALQVKELYERFASGHTLHECWRYMQKNYTTKYGAWSSETLVRHILQNDIYIGNVKFKGVSYKGRHEPIIPEELFYSVQDIFENAKRNTPSFRRSPFKAQTLLSNLIFCGKCGARFHGEHGNYACYSRTKGDRKYIIDPNCKNKKWKIADLDAIVTEYLTKLSFNDLEPRPVMPVKKDYSKRIGEIDRQLSNLIDLYQVGSIPMEVISQKADALAKEKALLVRQESESGTLPLSNEEILLFRDRFLQLLSSNDLQAKRACLTNVIEKIVVDDDNVDIILK